MTSRRLLATLGALVVILTAAGAASFLYYTRHHAPNPRLVAVAPFDIFAPGAALERWRVELAEALTERLAATPPLSSVPQAVVAQTWRSAPRPEISAVEVARQAGAGIAVYGRVDTLAADSVRVTVIAADAGSTLVLFAVQLRRPARDPQAIGADLARALRDSLVGPVAR